MKKQLFFDVAKIALSALGRDFRDANAWLKFMGVVAIGKDERVTQILAGPGSGKTEVLVWRVLYEMSHVCGTSS
jgi:hypothetical protein